MFSLKYLRSLIIGYSLFICQITFAINTLDGGVSGGGGGNALTSYSVQPDSGQYSDNSSKNSQLPKSILIYFHSVKNNQIHFSIARQINEKWELKQYQVDQSMQISEKILRSLGNSNRMNDWAEVK